MANTLIDIMPKILAPALETLRENAITAQLVNNDYSGEAAKKGAVIDVPVPSAMVAQDVVPAATSQNVQDLQIDTVPIKLNNWKEVGFALTDKDVDEIMSGAVNMQIQEAARTIANEIDKSILNLYKTVYNFTGTPGTTPMSGGTLTDVIKARTLLNKANARLTDRRVLLNPEAEGAALGLPAFQQYLQAGTDETIRKGMIGEKLGMLWGMNQNLDYMSHTAGTIAVSGSLTTNGAPQSVATADASDPQRHNPKTVHTISIDNAVDGGTVKVGDIFTVAGDAQTYRVVADNTVASNAVVVAFEPAPKVAWADGSAVTFKASHATNLVFHRDAFALAVRPFMMDPYNSEVSAAQSLTMVDPVSGIPLRLTIKGEHYRTRYSLDCLWGVGAVRPELAVRLAG